MITHKPCKGNGKTKGHGCDIITDVRFRKFGLCMSCYANWLYTSKDGKDMIAKATLKASKPRIELNKAIYLDKSIKRLPIVLKQTQIVFNSYIRERDKNKPCISSGFPLGVQYDAGHCFSVKQFSGLRFYENNVHAQSIGDNRFKEGNFESYILNVENRIGTKELNKLKELANNEKRTPKKWSIEEVEEIKKEYKLKLKNIK